MAGLLPEACGGRPFPIMTSEFSARPYGKASAGSGQNKSAFAACLRRNRGRSTACSLLLVDAGELHVVRPFGGVGGQHVAEALGTAGQRRGAHLSEECL